MVSNKADAKRYDDVELIPYQELCPVHLKDLDLWPGSSAYRSGSAEPWLAVRRKIRYANILKLETAYWKVLLYTLTQIGQIVVF